jgi:hypothetical protein
MFEFLNGSGGKEKKTCLHFYDDHTFEFKKREVESACLIDKKDGNIIKGWKHFFATEAWFTGFRNMHADAVTLTCDRDFIMDPFNRIKEASDPNSGKPKKGEGDIKKWTAQIAESMRYIVMNKPGNLLLMDRIALFLGVGLIIELLLFGASKGFHW